MISISSHSMLYGIGIENVVKRRLVAKTNETENTTHTKNRDKVDESVLESVTKFLSTAYKRLKNDYQCIIAYCLGETVLCRRFLSCTHIFDSNRSENYTNLVLTNTMLHGDDNGDYEGHHLEISK